uniref:Interleukin 26 n=1 Tax=Electrophorus electricus TaxID=8005 RepID=A0A4W4DMQ8_ELEEL
MRLRILTVLVFTALMRSCPGDKKAKCAQVDCLMRYVSLPMIKDMSRTLKSINKSLQKLNIADINKILEIYEDHIFKKLWTSDTEGPKRFIHSFCTLKDNVGSCVSSHSQLKHTTMTESVNGVMPQLSLGWRTTSKSFSSLLILS